LVPKAWHENVMVDHHLGDPVCTRPFLWVDDSLESNSQNTHAKDTIEDDISHSQGSHHYRHLSVMMFRFLKYKYIRPSSTRTSCAAATEVSSLTTQPGCCCSDSWDIDCRRPAGLVSLEYQLQLPSLLLGMIEVFPHLLYPPAIKRGNGKSPI